MGPQICLCPDTEQPAGGAKSNMLTPRPFETEPKYSLKGNWELGITISPYPDISHGNKQH